MNLRIVYNLCEPVSSKSERQPETVLSIRDSLMDYIQSERAWGWISYRCKYQTCDSRWSTLILLWKGAWAREEETKELWGHPSASTTPLLLQMIAQECGLWDAATAWWNVTHLTCKQVRSQKPEYCQKLLVNLATSTVLRTTPVRQYVILETCSEI